MKVLHDLLGMGATGPASVLSCLQHLELKGLIHLGPLIPFPVLQAYLWGVDWNSMLPVTIESNWKEAVGLSDTELGGDVSLELLLATGRLVLWRSSCEQLTHLERWFHHHMNYLQVHFWANLL